ncbi:hypothetical protein F1C15_15895 (plasmid) [Frigoribacterium sp. NBH87]|uniref:hypothetical protein n=1 Tax=Frigoribacterium sp. NBH87 TaxID=2596916 RepID=UPI001623851C|nr:hypothetical protein [Frigoribacterium sp. NBH87]QNE45453.1 hypothetical protein F1C15_15895 [Frigoribacterium sp. NBH87]
MADVRRPRFSIVDPVVTGWKIAKKSRDSIATMAANHGVSASEFVELMAAHVESTVPPGGTLPWMPEKKRDGELPIDSA